ncbi:MAG: CHRD domain-containing protein [Pseudomonadota bacterium]
MRRSILAATTPLAVATALLFVSASTQATLINATAKLDYAQEVMPSNGTPSNATGVAKLRFDTANNTLDVSASIHGIFVADVTFPVGPFSFAGIGPFHIHNAPAGANGPVVTAIGEAGFFSATASGLAIQAQGLAIDPSIVASLLAGHLYLNLHTLDYASGEIRGQISVPEAGTAGLLVLALVVGVLRARRRAAIR